MQVQRPYHVYHVKLAELTKTTMHPHHVHRAWLERLLDVEPMTVRAAHLAKVTLILTLRPHVSTVAQASSGNSTMCSFHVAWQTAAYVLQGVLISMHTASRVAMTVRRESMHLPEVTIAFPARAWVSLITMKTPPLLA
jgi:hypothetical protein